MGKPFAGAMLVKAEKEVAGESGESLQSMMLACEGKKGDKGGQRTSPAAVYSQPSSGQDQWGVLHTVLPLMDPHMAQQ
jgi:hypothetical protein